MAPPHARGNRGRCKCRHCGAALTNFLVIGFPSSPHSPAAEGPRPLHRRLLQAAADGHLDVFKRLARAVDVGNGRIQEAVEAVRDGHGDGALHVAARNGRARVCAYLIEELQMDVNAAAESGDTPLSYAVSYNKKEDVVKYLLDHGADPDKPVHHGLTALHIAVEKGICVMVELLLSKGADVNSLSYRGTPLHVAAKEDQGAVMKILLDYNADCNKEFPTMFTALFPALFAHSLNCVKHLIKAGADVTKGVNNFTPLIIAANEGLTDFYECLLEAGADPNVPDDSGLLPIEIAAFKNRREDVEILLRVTSRIPAVHDWTVDGVLKYVKSMQTDQDLELEGNKAYEKNDYSTAVKLYSMAIANADSGDATLLANRSLCWIKLGKGDMALIDAEACRALRPYWPTACYRQGAAHMLLKDYEKAYDAFLDGLKLDPTDVAMENALRKALNSMKISLATTELSELSIAEKDTVQD